MSQHHPRASLQSLPADEHTADSSARRNESAILRALESVGHAAAAQCLDVDESYVSKLKGCEQKLNFASLARMLAALGLKVVPDDALTIDRGRYNALLNLAETGFQALKDDRG